MILAQLIEGLAYVVVRARHNQAPATQYVDKIALNVYSSRPDDADRLFGNQP